MLRWTMPNSSSQQPHRSRRNHPRNSRQAQSTEQSTGGFEERKTACRQPSRAFSFLTARMFLLVLLTSIVLPAFSSQTHRKDYDLLRQIILDEKIDQLSHVPRNPIP